MGIDPYIVKLLEEDEDETVHSRADVEALQAALSREIQAHSSTTSNSVRILCLQHSACSKEEYAISALCLIVQVAVLSQGSNQTGTHDGKAINLHSQQALQSAQHPEQNLLGMEQVPRGGSIPEGPQQQPNDVGQFADQVSQTTGILTSQRNAIPTPVFDPQSQCLKLQKVGNQETSGGIQVPFAVLLPTLLPQLDMDRAMQLNTLYAQFQRKEVTREVFVRHMTDIVGNEKLRLSFNKLVSQLPSQTSAQQNNQRMPSFTPGISLLSGPHSFAQLQKKSPNYPFNSSHSPSPVVSVLTDSSYASTENNFQTSPEKDRQSESRIGLLGTQISSSSSSTVNQERVRPSIPEKGLHEQQQRHLASFSAANVNISGSSLKTQPYYSQMRQLTHHHQSMGSTPVEGLTQAMNMMSGAKIVIPATSKDNPLEKQLSDFGSTTTKNIMPMNSESPFLASQLDRNVLRADTEKPMHPKLITSGVQQQVFRLNCKAKEEWEKKQPEGSQVDGDKEKDEGQVKSVMMNKEEDDKMRATAANVTARAAVGGDDIMLKWQLMAEQARQKRKRGIEDSVLLSPLASGAIEKFDRNQEIVPKTRVARTISVEDVIAVLEREPQMRRSTMILRLYERTRSMAAD
ncbi:hypothetical protein REPUB_Repub12eG0177100 [Reevesia pubescens]